MLAPEAELHAFLKDLAASKMLLVDKSRLESNTRRLLPRAKRGQPVDRGLERLKREKEDACLRWLELQKSHVRLDYPEELPVSRERARVVDAITRHPVVIVCGDTGSGKTTQLPKMAYEAGGAHFGKIGVTQPRRLAATSMARRVAEECGVELGDVVGARVRFEDRTGPRTRLQFMTDGMLLAQLPHDPDWLEFNTLIIDEAHERSLNIDFILGCLRQLIHRRDDLRIIISSATLDAERFSEFFDKAPVIQVEGRLYPIEDIHLPPPDGDTRETSDQVMEALQFLDREHGELDTLVFLPGEREIREAAKKAEGLYRHRAEILPLFARLSLAEQQRVFRSGGTRRIVLATNVAETSVTLPGIRAVIDTGEVRVHRLHPQTQIQRLVTEPVSQASSRQRRGRCGRTGPGVCIRLYDEETLAKAPAYSDPEIRRSSLAEVILRMAALGLPPLGEFPLLDPPRGAHVSEGYRALHEIGAMTRKRELTPRGKLLATFPLEPRLARMLEEGHTEKVLPAVLVVVAFLSLQDPRERPAEKREAADRAHAEWRDPRSDFTSILNLWNAASNLPSRNQRRKFCERHFLNSRRVEEWINLVDDLRDLCDEHDWSPPRSIGAMELQDPDSLHRAILSGVPRLVGERADQGYRGPSGQNFLIFPGSGLAKKPPRWVMAFSLLETSRLFARECAELNPHWVEEVAPHLCAWQYERPVWNPDRGFVEAEERVQLGQLTLRHGKRVHYGRIDPPASREIFIRDGLVPANLRLAHPSLRDYRKLLDTLDTWEHKLRRPGYFTGGEPLAAFFRERLPREVVCTDDFKTWLRHAPRGWVPSLSDLFPGEDFREEEYPDHLEFPNTRVGLNYTFAPEDPTRDGLTLVLREEDLGSVPREALEWTVPAWLQEKVEALIRSLDKPIRNACQPIASTARDAIAWFHEMEFVWTHSLHQALASFLAVRLNRILAAPDLNPDKLTAHLVTHVTVVDANGKTVFRGDAFPGRHEARAAGPVPTRRAAGWHRSGLNTWPDLDLGQTVDVDGRSFFPALVDEGEGCGVRLYSRPMEARSAHRAGVLRLFRIRWPGPVRHLEKKFPLPTSVQLELSVMPGDALAELVDCVLVEALDMDANPPVDAGRFDNACERARGELFEIAEARGKQLREIFDLRSRVNEALLSGLASETIHDLELQQTTLWASGWIREPINLERYPTYLQGILRRCERARQDPAKDEKKRREFEPALTLLAEYSDKLSSNHLREAFRKLEELRLAVFAPELRTREKTSVTRLERWLKEITTP